MSAETPVPVTVAAVQMTTVADRDANLATAGRLLERAAAAGARIVPVRVDAEGIAGARDPGRDLAAVGDEDVLQHLAHIRKTP